MKSTVLAPWILLVLAAGAVAGDTLRGTVTDTITNAVLSGVTVRVSGTSDSSVTNAQGRFTLIKGSTHSVCPLLMPGGGNQAWVHLTNGTLVWQAAKSMTFRLCDVSGRLAAGHRACSGTGSYQLPPLANGLYELETVLDGGRSVRKILAQGEFGSTGNLHEIALTQSAGSVKKTAAGVDTNAVTLVFTKDGFQTKNISDTWGDTAIAARLNGEFIKVTGDSLRLGVHRYVVKGVNYMSGRYIPLYAKDQTGAEVWNCWQMFRTFDSSGITSDLQFLRDSLGVNSFRMFTPDGPDFSTWYLSDGTINSTYLTRLRTMVNIAHNLGLHIQFELVHQFQENEWDTTVTPNQLIDKGTPRETFYFKYLQSVVTPFADDPTIMAWEISNECLMTTSDVSSSVPKNYQHEGVYDQKVLSVIKRFADKIRTLDNHHLITSGQSVLPLKSTTYWEWPTPELALVPDKDSLNGGHAFSLASVIDYLAPHFYQPDSTMGPLLDTIVSLSTKPVAMGEIGYRPDSAHQLTLDKSSYEMQQDTFFMDVLNAIKTNKSAGLFLWTPLPMFDLTPGTCTKIPDTLSRPGFFEFQITRPSQRTIRAFKDYWELFYSNLTPMKAATRFRNMTF